MSKLLNVFMFYLVKHEYNRVLHEDLFLLYSVEGKELLKVMTGVLKYFISEKGIIEINQITFSWFLNDT